MRIDKSVSLGGPRLVIDRRAEHNRVAGVERLDLVDPPKVDRSAGIGETRRDARRDALGRSVAACVHDEHRHEARIAAGEAARVRRNPQAQAGLLVPLLAHAAAPLC